MEIAERSAMASGLSLSDIGTGEGSLGGSGGGATWYPEWLSGSVVEEKTGVIGEYGGAVGDTDPSITWWSGVSSFGIVKGGNAGMASMVGW